MLFMLLDVWMKQTEYGCGPYRFWRGQVLAIGHSRKSPLPPYPVNRILGERKRERETNFILRLFPRNEFIFVQISGLSCVIWNNLPLVKIRREREWEPKRKREREKWIHQRRTAVKRSNASITIQVLETNSKKVEMFRKERKRKRTRGNKRVTVNWELTASAVNPTGGAGGDAS